MPDRRDLANAVRILAMDAVQQANSGHPGMPMGMADIAEVLFNDYINLNPTNPQWADRDRFVLSNGHGSMLQYAVLHLTGHDVTLDDLRAFRQLHSKTPGHPENFVTPGVETTTGPLGQGLANAVGMALGEAALAATFNRPDISIVDHYTYCFAGDGCLMEGISHEACSLAGTLGLGKLIVLYDDNGISIDGETRGWFTDDTPARFEAYGWQVVRNVDGHDSAEIKQAIDTARREVERPTLICCKTVIGWGAPNKQGTAGAHGAALGDDEITAARAQIGWADSRRFAVPDAIYEGWDKKEAGAKAEAAWQDRFEAYEQAHPEQALEFQRRMAGQLPEDWAARMDAFVAQTQEAAQTTATRKASKATIETMVELLPELIGGSADLAGSNGTDFAGHQALGANDYSGNYVNYGVREFAMTAIASGLTLHGGMVPFVATFLTFSDYARNAVRMAALMRIRNILVYTHDSIGLGEDGPTHQPVEHFASLRLIPNLHVWRPGDAVETAVAWRSAVERVDGPTALGLTRQNVAHNERTAAQVQAIGRGGYVLHEPNGAVQAIVLATGSEVELAMAAARELGTEGLAVRVVSMPCIERFDAQEQDYRNTVLPPAITARVAVEAGSPDSWYRFVGTTGHVIGVNGFGTSAPAPAVFAEQGVTTEAVITALRAQIAAA